MSLLGIRRLPPSLARGICTVFAVLAILGVLGITALLGWAERLNAIKETWCGEVKPCFLSMRRSPWSSADVIARTQAIGQPTLPNASRQNTPEKAYNCAHWNGSGSARERMSRYA